MEEKKEIRVRFEIGDIKFEAEGSADLVERERSIFNNTLLPAAIEAIVITNVTAAPIPAAVLTLVDTPKNGQMPIN